VFRKLLDISDSCVILVEESYNSSWTTSRFNLG